MEPPGIYAREMPSIERIVQVGYASGKVISVSFPDSMPDGAETDHAILDDVSAYLEGRREEFSDVDVALTVPTDHRAVLEAVRGVPYGETVTIAQLARMTPGLADDDSDDLQLVRTALAENPAPLVIPVHRVEDEPSGLPTDVERAIRVIEGQ